MHCEKQDFSLFLQLVKSKIATFKLTINCEASNFTELKAGIERLQMWMIPD